DLLSCRDRAGDIYRAPLGQLVARPAGGEEHPAVIVLCANSTSWDYERDRLVPGGQGDRYLSPILRHLPEDARIARQPRAGATCALMNHWSTYWPGARGAVKASVQISHGI